MTARAIFPTFYDKETKIWSGAPRSALYDYNCSIGQVAHNTLKCWPTNVLQITADDDTVLTNADVLSLATRIALYFKAEGLTHEDRVGIIGKGSTYVMPVATACFFNTTPFHAVNSSREPQVVARLYSVTKPKIMFCDAEDYETIKEITKEWSPKIVTLTGRVEGVPSVEDLIKPHPSEAVYRPTPLAVGGDQTAAVLCSSGTAGLPKAVALSHRHLCSTNSFCFSADVVYTSAAIDWMTGFTIMVISLTCGFTRIVSSKPFSAEHAVAFVHKYKVTGLAMAPWQAYELYSSPLAKTETLQSLRFSLVIGGWVSLAVLRKCQALLPKCYVMFSYGTTETGIVTINIDQSLENSVGRVAPGMRVKILDENRQQLGTNGVGEVLIDIGLRWTGYVDNAEDTAATLQDGWINLGDLGYFDEDNNLYLVDRKKDLLKYKSKHYWPNEIEHVIAELPEIDDVCVVGVRDERYGDAAGALVIRKKGVEITAQKIIDHVAQRVVVDYKQLNAGVVFVDHIPTNINGKVMRSAARDIFDERSK
ncbi:luciferin 4-monooxygenase [Drosophila pseudoobscura]|uniref:Luciferin 4-monooxygenase n=1 Tax=Drosophila pseudoobscura pseudoobscura TaxID=46245 RepID=A0A6I8UWF4_DROPS|nr:luciferin 4-monooxygenase [Drosophila pseudoobscura]